MWLRSSLYTRSICSHTRAPSGKLSECACITSLPACITAQNFKQRYMLTDSILSGMYMRERRV